MSNKPRRNKPRRPTQMPDTPLATALLASIDQMQAEGLVTVDGDYVELTDKGRALAAQGDWPDR